MRATLRESCQSGEEKSRGRECEIVGAVGNQFVTEGFEDLAVSQEEGAGHALNISGRQADKIAFKPGHQHAIDAFPIEILAQFSVGQAEGVVKLAVGIGNAGEIVEMIGSEKFGGAVFGAKMDEGQAGAFGFEFSAKFGELGDRLATEGSAKVAQEDEQERMVEGERVDGFARVRTVRFEESRGDVFGSEHG